LTYVEIAKAIADPATIGQNMPTACVDYLKSGDPNFSRLFKLDADVFMVVLTSTIQFIFASVVVFLSLRKASSSYLRTYRMLKVSALATIVTLGLPAIAVGAWIILKVVHGGNDITLTYTKQPNLTGGCTFGVVDMDKRWGYWDVEYERPFRIFMSIVGAA
jgi:hypothetical protein